MILVVGTNAAVESEEFDDRTTLTLPGRQDNLARRILDTGTRTIAVVNAGAPVKLP